MVAEMSLNSIGRNPVHLEGEGRILGRNNSIMANGQQQPQVPGRRDDRAPNQIILEQLVENFDVSRHVVSKRGGLGHGDYMDRIKMMEILINIDLC